MVILAVRFHALFKLKAQLGLAQQIVRLAVLSLPAYTLLKRYTHFRVCVQEKVTSCVGSYDSISWCCPLVLYKKAKFVSKKLEFHGFFHSIFQLNVLLNQFSLLTYSDLLVVLYLYFLKILSLSSGSEFSLFCPLSAALFIGHNGGFCETSSQEK